MALPRRTPRGDHVFAPDSFGRLAGWTDVLAHAAGIGSMCLIGFADEVYIASIMKTNYYSDPDFFAWMLSVVLFFVAVVFVWAMRRIPLVKNLV